MGRTPNKNWSLQKQVWEDGSLSTTEKIVAAILVWHRNAGTGACWPSNKTVAKEAAISREAVNRAIKELIAKGWLEPTGKIRRVVNYRIRGKQRLSLPMCDLGSHKPLIREYTELVDWAALDGYVAYCPPELALPEPTDEQIERSLATDMPVYVKNPEGPYPTLFGKGLHMDEKDHWDSYHGWHTTSAEA